MKRLLMVFALLTFAGSAAAFDQTHAAWSTLLKKHVRVIDHGVASQVDYAGFKRDKKALDAYTQSLSAVPEKTFDGWNKPQREAFLINAYNAFTMQLILSQYPNLKSIKDLGGLLSSPWKKDFFTLFGHKTHLDHIEQDLLRGANGYQEPRIHFALNCASVGCPMLRPQAYVGDKLDAQLDEQMRRFLSDRSRNRYDAKTKKLEVSRIFDWYGEDFTHGWHGFTSVRQALSKYADVLADDTAAQQVIRAEQVPLTFLDYDWSLNDVRH